MLAVVVVALVATSFALARKPPAMSATDSVTFARRALAAAGVEGADVGRQPRTSVFTLDDGTEVGVWIVPADVRGELVEVYVPRSRTLPCDGSVLDRLPGTRACPADRAVNLDDEVDDGRFLFTEDQFAALEDFRLNPALDRQRDRRIGPAVAAGSLVAIVGVALAVGTGRSGGVRRRRKGRSREAPTPG